MRDISGREKKQQQLSSDDFFFADSPNHRISRLMLKDKQIDFTDSTEDFGHRGHIFLLGQESPSPCATSSNHNTEFSSFY